MHPFQCITTAKASAGSAGHLLAACGPRLLSTRLKTGDIVSEWTSATDSASVAQTASPALPAQEKTGSEDAPRPTKKQKTAASSPASSITNIIKLSLSPDCTHAVAVTDDKCLRVFHLSTTGELAQLSQRNMPKRPCAIQILPDNSTVLCGDKFGDVYSLPLHPDPDYEDKVQAEPSKPTFKPSATSKTVHTKRNLKSLQEQLKQKNITPKSKGPLAFQHSLLLGHVSMLTDVAYATCEIEGKQGGHIITADRDEHIRISRAPPQSWIIEGYCLGHTEFISKICIIPGTNLLVSGGGDDWLGVWEWPAFKLRSRVNGLGKLLRERSGTAEAIDVKIAVSGIWTTKAVTDGAEDHVEDVVAVTSERGHTVAYCRVADLFDETKWTVQQLDSSLLDVTSSGSSTILSLDVREESKERLRSVELRIGKKPDGSSQIRCDVSDAITKKLSELNAITQQSSSDKTLDDLLYGIANLRKREHHVDAPEDGAEEEAEADA